MRITDLLKRESISLNASPKDKAEAIDMLVDLQVNGGCISDKDEYKKGILAREEHGSTAVGEGIAIPHAKNKGVKAPSLAAMTVPAGVDYEALDDEPSNLLFMIAAPEGGGDVHLDVLAKLMTILMDEDFRAKLLAAEDKDEFLKIIDDMEAEKYPEETPRCSENRPCETSGRSNKSSGGYRLSYGNSSYLYGCGGSRKSGQETANRSSRPEARPLSCLSETLSR